VLDGEAALAGEEEGVRLGASMISYGGRRLWVVAMRRTRAVLGG
jgi:hypothetical protein